MKCCQPLWTSSVDVRLLQSLLHLAFKHSAKTSMRFDAKYTVCGVILGLLVLTGISNAGLVGDATNSSLQIRLRPATRVTSLNVRLTDIATFFLDGRLCTLDDLPVNLQRQLRRVEVTRLSSQRLAAIVTRQAVKTRLPFQGAKDVTVELIGPDIVLVSMAAVDEGAAAQNPFRLLSFPSSLDSQKPIRQAALTTLSDLSVERAILDELASQFGIVQSDLQVRLLRSIVDPGAASLKDIVNPLIEVTAPAQFPYGRQSLVVRILDGEKIAMTRTVTVNVRLRRKLLLTRRPVSAGAKIDSSMLSEEIRFVERQYDELIPEDVIGMVAARSMRPNDIVDWANMRDSDSVSVGLLKPLVKARDAVQVIASHKSLRISISAAEALGAGRKGQLIKVRNLQSKKVFTGRVIAAGQVELIL